MGSYLRNNNSSERVNEPRSSENGQIATCSGLYLDPFQKHATFGNLGTVQQQGQAIHVQIKCYITIAKTSVTLYSLIPFYILKFGSDRMRSSVLKCKAPYGPVLTKISIKCHKIFNLWQMAKTSITLNTIKTTLFIIKFGSDGMKIGGGVAF